MIIALGDVQDAFLRTLLRVNVPGVSQSTRIHISNHACLGDMPNAFPRTVLRVNFPGVSQSARINIFNHA